MMTYLEVLLAEVKHNPQQLFVGLCVFFVAVMGTSIQHVASTGFTLLVLFSFSVIGRWGETWKDLTGNEKIFLASLGLYALSGVIAFINIQDTQEYIKELERYLRFALAIPIYLLIKTYKFNVINYLYAGAVVSGPFLFFIAFSDYLDNPNTPARGYYHHIIFGGAAMLNVGVMISILLKENINNFIKIAIIVFMLCGFVAAVLSQSRGVWLVLPLYILVAMYYSLKHSRQKFGGVIAVFVLMGAVLVVSPVGDMVKKRVDIAVDEVSAYYVDDKYISSIGTRLAMWDIAIDVWKQHPVVGTGPGDFDDIILALQKDGQYKGMEVHGSTHNVYMQSLVNAGLIGFITMVFALFIMPLKMLFNKSESGRLAGFIIISSFAVYGLSESWTLRLPTISVFIVYMIVIISCINVVDSDNNKTK